MDNDQPKHDRGDADDSEAPEADRQEQLQGLDDAGGDEGGDVDNEVPEADALEQRRPVSEHGTGRPSLPPDADEADAYEQSIDAGDEEDDFR